MSRTRRNTQVWHDDGAREHRGSAVEWPVSPSRQTAAGRTVAMDAAESDYYALGSEGLPQVTNVAVETGYIR